MNVLIVGTNEVNGPLEQSLTLRGIGVYSIPCIETLACIKGKPGFFSAVTTKGEIAASGVVITQPPVFEDTMIGDGKAIGLHEAGLPSTFEATDRAHKIIFLLDYLAETPEYVTAKALKTALNLARQGRQIVLLSQFVKTSTYGMEQVYRDARHAGVCFIKYEDINCQFEAGMFNIKAFDGVFTSEFNTPTLVAAGKEQEETREQIIRKFRLTQSNNGYINGNKFFLGSVFTSRRGVFYVNPDICPGAESLETVVSTIVAELCSFETQPVSYAKIDAKKCAFCYSCYRVCPHGALEPDLGPDVESNAMTCETAACTACGACAAICPGQAITIMGNEAGTLASGRDYNDANILVSGSGSSCKVFNCQNTADITTLPFASGLDVEKIPCGGGIGQEKIAAALADYDKVLLAVCMDDACRHMVGGKRGCQQAFKLMESVKKLGLGSEDGKKIGCIKISDAMPEMLTEQMQRFLKS